MKKTLLTFASAALLSLPLIAQNGRTCGTAPMPQDCDWITKKILEDAANKLSPDDAQAVYNIPVIVHVIHNGENVGTGTNVSQAQINSQFDVLNEDFNKLNADFTTVCPSVFQPVAADCDINWCKALRDPQGNTLTEPGIDRINRNTMGWTAPPYSTSYINGTIKPNTIWDVNNYCNIWIMNLGGGLLGYATFPAGSTLTCLSTPFGNTTNDGVVCLYNAFGRVGNVAAPFNKGRTATHELGHWLGLRHIWGDANCGSDCVTDTPAQQTYNFGCPTFPSVTCNNGPNGDMFVNYMDYVDDACMVMFTTGQRTRVQTCMANGTYRVPLNNSTVCSLSTSVNDIDNKNKFNLYPNPTSGIVTIEPLDNSTNVNLLITNAVGEIVFSQQYTTMQKTNVDLTSFGAGVYFVEISNAIGKSTQKLVLSK
jgi:hypothetical protein